MKASRLHFRMNPIIVKELRSRMRDWRAFATLTGMLLLLGAGSYLLYRIILATSYYSASPLSPQIGQSLFISLAVLELMVIAAVAPAVTAGTISSEHEKLTYDMLVATPMRPGTILWGKMISSLSYVFLLIFASIPMASLIFIFGGVTLRDMAKALIILAVLAVTLGMIGLFMSAWMGRTARATVLSYLVVAALIVGPAIAYISVGILRQAEPPRWLLVASPVSALLSAITTTSSDMSNPINSIFWAIGMGMSGSFNMLTGATVSQTGIPRPLYHYSLPLYGLITLVLYLLSTRLVRPTRRWHISRKELVASLVVVVLYLALIAGAFLATTSRYEAQSIFASPSTPASDRPVMIEGPAPAVPIEKLEGGSADGGNPPPGPTPTPLPPPTGYPGPN